MTLINLQKKRGKAQMSPTVNCRIPDKNKKETRINCTSYIHMPVNRSTVGSYQPNNSINRSIYQLIDQSINQSINQSIYQTTYHISPSNHSKKEEVKNKQYRQRSKEIVVAPVDSNHTSSDNLSSSVWLPINEPNNQSIGSV